MLPASAPVLRTDGSDFSHACNSRDMIFFFYCESECEDFSLHSLTLRPYVTCRTL